MFALRDKEGSVATNMDKVLKIAEQFYRDLYSSRDNQGDNTRRINPEGLDIPPVMPEEVKKALDAMQTVKVAGGDQVIADLLKHGGQIVPEQLATQYRVLQNSEKIEEK